MTTRYLMTVWRPWVLCFCAILPLLHCCTRQSLEPGSDVILCLDPMTYEESGHFSPAELREPSGAVFHPSRETIFLVGDEGDLEELTLEGQSLKSIRLRAADFEGVTVNPQSGLLYIIIEGAGKILEVDPATMVVLREITIDWRLNGQAVLAADREAMEAITFLPDSLHPLGGTFLVANRSRATNSTAEPSSLIELDVPLPGEPGPAQVIRKIDMVITGMSGLHFAARENLLFIVSDDGNACFEATPDGELGTCYALPGTKQEGVTRDDEGFVYIADDTEGRMYKLR